MNEPSVRGLVVDDDPGVIAFLSTVLRRRGIEAECAANGGEAAAAFFVFHIGEHGFAENAQSARGHAEMIAHAALRVSQRRFARQHVLRFEARDEPRPKNLAAIGDRGSHDRHLQGSHGDLTLPNTNVGGFALDPAGAHPAQ